MRVRARAKMKLCPSRSLRCAFRHPRTKSLGTRRGTFLWGQGCNQVVGGLIRDEAMWSGKDKSRLRQASRRRREKQSRNLRREDEMMADEVQVETCSENYKSSYLVNTRYTQSALLVPYQQANLRRHRTNPSIHVIHQYMSHQPYLAITATCRSSVPTSRTCSALSSQLHSPSYLPFRDPRPLSVASEAPRQFSTCLLNFSWDFARSLGILYGVESKPLRRAWRTCGCWLGPPRTSSLPSKTIRTKRLRTIR